MIWTIVEEQLYDENTKKHAGGKAREDVSKVLLESNCAEILVQFPRVERQEAHKLQKFLYHYKVARRWNKALKVVGGNDSIILQFPAVNHTLMLNNVLKRLKKRGVKINALIHDLEIIRMTNDVRYSKLWRWRMKKEELDELHEFNKIIVHNKAMKEFLVKNLVIDENRIIELGIFDYLIDKSFSPDENANYWKSCIIAGNLNRGKSAYIYNLPSAPNFELYGINYEGCNNGNIHYHGSFLADELPFHLKGGFGLVWDGDSVETCNGAWGEYLKYNNPHKTSLYLACGIPVIIWEEAALADYIKRHNVGITVKSLHEIDDAISSITEDEYRQMKENAISISKELRNGENTKRALRKIGII